MDDPGDLKTKRLRCYGEGDVFTLTSVFSVFF